MKCIIEGCEAPQSIRGLCSAHYTYVLDYLKAGVYTEAELMAAGFILPSKHRGEKKMLLTDMLKKRGLAVK